LLQLLCWKVEFMYKKRFPTFSLTIHRDEWILSSPKRFSNLGEHYHYRFNLYRFDTTCFDDDNTCTNSCHSKEGTILHKVSAKRWFHSPCYKDIWLSPSSFWFLFNFLCTWQYSSPLAELHGTFNAYILL
jgi:hypothetical protein